MEWVGPAISAGAAIIVAIIEVIASKERKRSRANMIQSQAVITGVQALLRNEVIAKYNHYVEKGHIPIYGMENVLDMYNAYKHLGGNGTLTKLVDALRELPTEPQSERT